MANALFLDFSISESDDMRGTTPSGHRPTTVNVISDATGLQRDKLRAFFDGLVRLSDADLNAVEAVVSRLAHADDDEGESVEELLAEDNRRIRNRFVAELSPLRRPDVLQLASAGDRDAEPVLEGWIARGEVFFVIHEGCEYFPSFQFEGGRPRPVIKDLLALLRPELSAWQRAFWFVSANGWLSGKAPADLLDRREDVLSAARRELEPLIG